MGSGSSIAKQTTVMPPVIEKGQETELPKATPAGIRQGRTTCGQTIPRLASRHTDDPDAQPANDEWKRYLSNARSSIDRVRRSISDHRNYHVHVCELSGKRVEASIALLRQTRLHCRPRR
jgi:hypothetical protein